ncbi:hypothetical protein ACL9RF_09760 [Sphingobacterium sp. Mn56C]|uniref:hypothetical protein n=1 Tax=Sphingobacterium sp. Mn56C TaxID=3395261 RepID=UPI003BE50DC5
MHRQSKGLKVSKTLKFIFSAGIFLTALQANAQKTTSNSPYSQFGIGQMREDLLPQTRAMGGIATGVRFQSGLATLNIFNPASYTAFSRTILEAGLYGNTTQLAKGGIKDNTADFAFSHFAIGIPLNKAGGVAFGLMPYSDIGYRSVENTVSNNIVNQRMSYGEGGTNKAFVGYGVSPFKGLSIGANVGLIFGELKDISTISFPNDLSMLRSSSNETREINGVTVDYGAQYSKSLGNKLNLTLGYSGSLNNTIKSTTTITRTRTDGAINNDIENVARDTVFIANKDPRKINLPLKHNVGFTLSKGYNWMVGADFKYADWSNFQPRQGQPQLGKNIGGAIGGQFKPDPTSVKYWNVVDYRLGFRYNQTQVRFQDNKINDMAVTVGLGLPMPETNFGRTFSRINISAEFGQQGSLSNNLVRERYINLNIGFTINDTWFLRRGYD